MIYIAALNIDAAAAQAAKMGLQPEQWTYFYDPSQFEFIERPVVILCRNWWVAGIPDWRASMRAAMLSRKAQVWENDPDLRYV